MSKFKLYTGQLIDYIKEINFDQYVLNTNITYKTLEVDYYYFIQALKSVTFNGIRQGAVNTIDDKIRLILDYVEIHKTVKNKYYALLAFDTEDEQEYSLCLRLNDIQSKRCSKLDDGRLEEYKIEMFSELIA
jgi:hypothetical protein